MPTIEITDENLEDFDDLLPEDIAENIGRETFRAAALVEKEKALAAMIWEINNLENESKDTTSRISWISPTDPSGGEKLFGEYGSCVHEVGAVSSHMEFPVADVRDILVIFKNAGFNLSKAEGGSLTVTIEDLSKLDVIKKTKLPANLKSIETLAARPFRRGLMNCIINTKRELLEDLSTLPMDWFDTDISCYVETDERITGFLLVHRLPSGKLRLEFMSAIGPDAKIDLFYMVRYSILQAIKKYPKDTNLIIPRRDKPATNLCGYFFPGKKGVSSIVGVRKEL